MHGYFLRSKKDPSNNPKPTLIWLSGAESIAEDVYWWCGAEGMERGINVFVVDNPGDTATRIYNEKLLIDGPGDHTLLSQMEYLRHGASSTVSAMFSVEGNTVLK